MFDIDLSKFKLDEPELRDLTCDEIKKRARKIVSEIEDAYARNWLQSDEHELETPEPIFDAEKFADEMSDIMFGDNELSTYWHSVRAGFKDLTDK